MLPRSLCNESEVKISAAYLTVLAQMMYFRKEKECVLLQWLQVIQLTTNVM